MQMLRGADASYTANPLRQNLFRALARLGVPCAAILMPLGFFLSVASPRAERPNGLILLTYVGAVSLALGVLALGVALLWSVAR